MQPEDLESIVRAIIAGGESFYTEFKTAWEFTPDGERRPRAIGDVAADVGRTVVAFANAEGGDLLVGVEDSGAVTGVPFEAEKLLYLLQSPRHHVEGADLGVRVHEARVDGRTVLLFRVSEHGEGVVVTSDGRCLLRRDARSVPVAPKEVERRRSRVLGDVGYEAEPVSAAVLEDLDETLLLDAARARIPISDLESILRYWNLAESRNGTLVLRRAALLLFARQPLRWHANNRIRIRRVHGDDEGYGRWLRSREQEVVGPIVGALRDALRVLARGLEVERQGQQSLFTTGHTLPTAAVEECLVNALIHRNYAIEGQAVEVLLYPDHVEFRSPGGLPEPITLADLRALRRVHRSRNPIIMRVMRDLGWARDQGEGMRRIFGAMRQVELHVPDLELVGDTFVVRLGTRSVYDEATQAWIAAYGPFGLQPEERKYLVTLRQHGGRLSTDRLARALGQGFDDTKRHLVRLERKGMVWHRHKSRTFHVVEPLEVPFELAFRRLSDAGVPLSADTTFDRQDLARVAGHPDDRSLADLITRWKEANVLAPAGRGRWRYGTSLLEYGRKRSRQGGS